jgi:hypothetical protein
MKTRTSTLPRRVAAVAMASAAAMSLAGCASSQLEKRVAALEAGQGSLERQSAGAQASARDLAHRVAAVSTSLYQLDQAMRTYSRQNGEHAAQMKDLVHRLDADLTRVRAELRDALIKVNRFRVITTDSGVNVVVAD